MKKLLLASAVMLPCILGAFAAIAEESTLKITTDAFGADGVLKSDYARCLPLNPPYKLKGVLMYKKPGLNKSVGLSWSGAPEGTKSYVILLSDKDANKKDTPVDTTGEILKADTPRQTFYSWVLSDIPASKTAFEPGEDSLNDHETEPKRNLPYGHRGMNSLKEMSKTYTDSSTGYHGACPPWNDEKIHRLNLAVYALDIETLAVEKNYSGAQAEKAMKGHILAKGEVSGTYTLNPAILFKK